MKITKEEYIHYYDDYWTLKHKWMYDFYLLKAMDGSPMIRRTLKKWVFVLLLIPCSIKESELIDKYYKWHEIVLSPWNCVYYLDAVRRLRNG